MYICSLLSVSACHVAVCMLQDLPVLSFAGIQNCQTHSIHNNAIDLPLCTSTYEAGLQEAAALQQQSVKLSTVKACITVAGELMDWQQRMDRSMAIAIPGERKEKFTLFSDHNGSLLRRSPEL